MSNPNSVASTSSNDVTVQHEEPRSDGRRTLKHGDAFAVCNSFGDIQPGPGNEEGFYFDGTRFLSTLTLKLNDDFPLLLGSYVRDQNDALVVTLTNPALRCGTGGVVPPNEVQIVRRTFLLENHCYVSIDLQSFCLREVDFSLALCFAPDYADIYEIRGAPRLAHGVHEPAAVGQDQVHLSYLGLDNERRETSIDFVPTPTALTASRAEFRVRLQAAEATTISLTIACERSRRRTSKDVPLQSARTLLAAEWEQQLKGACTVSSSNLQFTKWFEQSFADLHMLTTALPTGPYPYAGIPWFNTPFGRDGLITALECLWMRPELARGVLAYLAETQATQIVPDEDAEPGKIQHEIRSGEMAALKEMPFGRYYGSVDATPLFVLLAGAYLERTADISFVRQLWPAIHAALRWMTDYGDLDGDGFLEYKRHSPNGLIHQGWKDSDDAIFHADGTPAEGALAVCEVQAYAYAAYLSGATIAQWLDSSSEAECLKQKARELRVRLNETFWCEELGMYGLALDGEKRLCRVASSNAGQCLFSGIASPQQARRIADALFSTDCYSGWGIRTISRSSVRYNPMSYHNGSVWPHDNAMIAFGLARYGLADHVSRLFEDISISATYFDRYRLPELYCGFDREAGVAPVPYPNACAPQAWSAASIFLMIQACLGLQVDPIGKQVRLVRPLLPASLRDICVHNLQVGSSRISFEVSGRGKDLKVRPIDNQDGCTIVLC